MVVSTILSLIVILQFTQFSALAVAWAPETPVVANANKRDASPSMFQASDGKIWVAYSSDKDDPNGDIYYVTYSGSAWSAQQRLTTDPDWIDSNPAIMQATNGVIWVVWVSDRELNNNIYYKTSSNGGTSWSPDTILTTDMASDDYPSITQTTNGKIWVVWAKKPVMGNYDIYYKTYDGSNWSTLNGDQLTTDTNGDFNPSIIQTWDGKVWVFWGANRNQNFDIYYKTYDGASWSPDDTRLTTTDKNDADPAVTEARDGLLWVAWRQSDRTGSQSDIYYKTYNGTGWSPTESQITTTNTDDVAPSIINPNDGKIWVAYQKILTTNDHDIYYMTSDPIPVHDIAITGVAASPALLPPIYQGDIVRISVTAQNQGTQSETFTVTAYANSTSVGSQAVTLAAEASSIVPINWNTTGFKRGNYTTSASASIVPNEYLRHQGDNTFTDGTVRVRLMGDVKDDGFVNILDLSIIGVCFGKSTGDPLYKPEADINHNGTIDITDLATAGRNYGKRG